MKEKIIGFGILALVVLGAGYIFDRFEKIPQKITLSAQEQKDQSAYANAKISVGSQIFDVELAITPDQQSKGLSDRDKLETDHGMLFIFKPATQPAFWMKDMKFNIDIVWISNGEVVEISRNLPFPSTGTRTDELPTYSPPTSIDYVLEVNAGEAKNISVGDRVEIINTLSV